LRASTFVEPTRYYSKGASVTFGYACDYAAAVHEMMQSPSGNEINWKRVNSGPKFFESSLKRNTDRVVEIVAMHMI